MGETSTDFEMPRLTELSDKCTGKNETTVINVSQALLVDILNTLCPKFEALTREITAARAELKVCAQQLDKARAREEQLLTKVDGLQAKVDGLDAKVDGLEKKLSDQTNGQPEVSSKHSFYLIGSSILREIKPGDISNGTVKCIPGGHIKDVKECVRNLKVKPKTIVTQIGGNDLSNENTDVEQVSTDYTTLLTEIKTKFPAASIAVSGLPPRFPNHEIRTKVKEFNETTKTWCSQNGVKFIDNEIPFELRSGEIDSSAYILTGATPRIHLNRRGTVRMLENLGRHLPDLVLSEGLHEASERTPKRQPQRSGASSYAEAAQRRPGATQGNQTVTRRRGQAGPHQESHTGPAWHRQADDGFIQVGRERGCYNCSETNHTIQQCRAPQGLTCWRCGFKGHKEKFCETNSFNSFSY